MIAHALTVCTVLQRNSILAAFDDTEEQAEKKKPTKKKRAPAKKKAEKETPPSPWDPTAPVWKGKLLLAEDLDSFRNGSFYTREFWDENIAPLMNKEPCLTEF